MAFCGDAESWGPVGMPKLWRWNGGPRFDLDDGGTSICRGIPAWFDWSVGSWHVFTGTWDRQAGKLQFFLDGRLIGSKSVTPWTNEPGAGFAVGYGMHIDGKGVNWARALIDSVTVFDAPLSALTVSQRARRLGIRPAAAPRVPPHPDWRNSLAPKGTAAPALTLARDGEAVYTILMPAEPTNVEQKAGADLAEWLCEITGARRASNISCPIELVM